MLEKEQRINSDRTQISSCLKNWLIVNLFFVYFLSKVIVCCFDWKLFFILVIRRNFAQLESTCLFVKHATASQNDKLKTQHGQAQQQQQQKRKKRKSIRAPHKRCNRRSRVQSNNSILREYLQLIKATHVRIRWCLFGVLFVIAVCHCQ